MRYVSVLSTSLEVPSERRRLGPLPASKWRFPARDRMTLPVAVILKRLATDFFVFIPFGRRIKFPVKMSAKYRRHPSPAQVERLTFFDTLRQPCRERRPLYRVAIRPDEAPNNLTSGL